MTAPAYRKSVAREVERVLSMLDRGSLPGASPLRRPAARRCEDLLQLLSATLAGDRPVTARGVLLALYSLGLGLPFIALAVGFSRAQTSTAWLRRHARAVETTGGVLLVIVGVSFVTGAWRGLFVPLQRWFARFGRLAQRASTAT